MSNGIQFTRDSYKKVISDSDIGKQCRKWISRLEGVTFESNSKIYSKFDNSSIKVSKISTGCKTFINIFLNPNTPVFIGEAGDNIIEEIYKLHNGVLYAPYMMIPYGKQFDKYGYVCVSESGEKTHVKGLRGIEEWYNGIQS